MKRKLLFVLFALCCVGWTMAYGQSTILSTGRYTNWSYAGVTGGIPSGSWTQCGATITSGTSSTIAGALNHTGAGYTSCSANTYVLVSGTFTGLSQILVQIPGTELRLANGTTLNFTSGSGCVADGSVICFEPPSNNWYQGSTAVLPQSSGTSNCPVLSGFTQGSTSLTLGTCPGTPPSGAFTFVLDQANDGATNGQAGDTGGVFVCDYSGGSNSCQANGSSGNINGRTISGSPTWNGATNYVTADYGQTEVLSGSVSGSTLTLTQPIKATNYRVSQTPGIWWTGRISNVGVNCLGTCVLNFGTITGKSGISFNNVDQFWVEGVTLENSGPPDEYFIWPYQSSHGSIINNYFYLTNASSPGSDYGVGGWITSDLLVQNNIFQLIPSPIQSDNVSGNVYAYNFSVNDWYYTAAWQADPYASHNAGGHMNLWEGNQFEGAIYCDNEWGTANLNTYFRNWLTGQGHNQAYNASSNLTSLNIQPVTLQQGCRGWNIIGNVLGTPGVFNQYQITSGTSQCDTTIYQLGFAETECRTPGNPNNDSIVLASLMRWGNYDTFNGGTPRFNAGEGSPAQQGSGSSALAANISSPSTTLPSSFYLASKPAWFGSNSYPVNGPGISGGSGPGGYAQNNPAAACYYNVMGGPSNGSNTLLAFNAATCYAATSATANPTFSPPAGTYSSAQSVVISSATPSAFICTNTTGSIMSTTGGTLCVNGTHYTGPVTVSSSETLYAIAGATGFTDSSQVSASYNIPTSNASLPFLPKVWNDLNEETCQIPSDPSYPCYNGPNGPSPGLLLHAPQYVLTLSPTGGVFSLVQGSPMTLSGGKPPAIAVCSITALGYTSFTFANSYMDSGNGRQQARIDVEKYRACSGGVIGGIIVLPVSASSETGTCGSYNGAKIYCAGAPGSVAPASGFYLPLTSTIQATSPIIERSLQDAVLQGKSQPVCNGGIQFNLPTSTAPGVLNDDCIGDHIAYQLGSIVYCANGIAATNNDPSTCTYTGSFVFGAKTVNTAQFNYAQYMFHASCSGLPFCETERVCSATIISNYLSGASPLCPVSANLTYQTAADHWEIEDEGISIPPQTQNNAVLFDVGSAVQAVFPTQFANDIRCRRCWAHGDWSTLAAGTNQIAAGFGMSACNMCSVVDSSTSMMLRPGAEGHQGNSDGDYQRWENDFFSGQSSGVFAGGFSNTPATPTFTPNMDSTFARVNFYFPQSWLGINCSYNSISGNSGGNACGNIPDNNIYYGGAGDNFPSTVGLVDPCIGPLLTPPVSVPSWATCVTINSTRVVVTYMGTGPTFHDDASSWQRTTSILFNPTYTKSYGVGTSGRCQTSLSDTTAKQCSFATWVPSCVANGGEFSSGTGCYPGSPPTSITLTYPVTGCYNLVGGVATFQTTCDGTTPQTMIVNGTSIVRKNIWEFKNAQRLLAYGIIGGNVDNSGGQNAASFVISPRQTSGTGIEGNSYFTQDTDVLCISCYFYNSGTGFDIGGRSESNSGDGAGASMPTQRVGLWNFMEVNVSRQNPGANTNAYGSYISTGSQAWLTGTTGGVSCTGTQCTFTAGAGINVDVAQTLNAPLESDTGITGSSSAKTVTVTVPNTFVLGETISFVLTGTCLDGIPYKVTVTGNPFTAVGGLGAADCTATITTGTVQGPVGYQVFDFQKGDPVYVYGCTGGSASAINMPSNTAYSSSLHVAVQTGSTYTGYATAASTPWDPVNGWNTSMTTVTYTWATSGPVTDTFGTCTIQNGPGNPQYVTINHATFDTDSNNPLGGGANLAKSSVIQFNSAIVNSILLTNTNPAYSGYNCNVVGNCGFWDSVILPAPQGGTNTEIEQNDVTTATISRLVWPGLASGTCTTTPTAPWNVNGSCTYTPYNNNPLFPAGLSMFFPPTQCNVGFVGTPPWQFGCTGNIVPLSPNDYHQLALYPGSTYSGTCIGIPCGPAADGSDEGAIITGTGFNGSSIDDAQTRLLFACTMAGASYASQCWPSAGTNPGPFPYSNNVAPPTITDIVIQGKPVFKGKPVIK